MRLLLSACCLALMLAFGLAAPPGAWGGGYAVTACFGIENGAWAEWEPSPFATAYVACPGGVIDLAHPQSGEGMVVRNTAGSGHAPQDAEAALSFDAPAGTTIAGLDFDAAVTLHPGWRAGVFDATGARWLFCGAGCRTPEDDWFHQELRGLATQRVQALVRCVAERCRRDVRRGVIALRDVRVHLSDDSAPQLGGLRGALGAADGWLRGAHELAFDAADNSGIQLGRVELDGGVLYDDARPCDFTRAVPCADGTTIGMFDTRTWADGEHRLRVGAQDAGGNWSWAERTVRTDNTAPAEPVPALHGGADWRPERVRTVVVPLPAGQAAPLVRARMSVCRTGGGCQDTAAELRPVAGAAAADGGDGASGPVAGAAAAADGGDGASGPVAGAAAAAEVAAFDGPGEYAVRVALEDAAGNVGPAAPPLTLRFDDTPPGAPDLSAADDWRNGGALSLGTEGAPPVSGVRGYRVRIGGREAIVATSLPLDDLPEGGTPVEVRAVSGAGLESTAVRTMLRLDRSRPAVTADGVPDPAAWSRTPVRIGLRGRDQPGLSGLRSLSSGLDDGTESVHEGDEAVVEIAQDGRHTLAYRALDWAGNASADHTIAVKVDRTPPETVAFEAPDAADPRLVRVVVSDATSGVAAGRIDLRRVGGAWRAVPTSLEAGRLMTRLDDAELRAGAYELRAHAVDAAGNEALGLYRADGSPMRLSLPLRRRTAIAVRRAGRTLRGRLSAEGSPLGGREVTLAERLRGRTRWRTLCGPQTAVAAASAAPEPGAAARAGRAVEPSAAAEPGAAFESGGRAGAVGEPGACTLRTDVAGRVAVTLPPGPSRTLRLSFAGDALLLPAHGAARVRTPARAGLRALPGVVRAGEVVRFAGRLLGGHVPRAGKLVELQARVGARWRTFATARTDPRGRLHHAHRFAPASAGRTYRIRLRVRHEAAYPFATGTSRAVAVRVV